MEVPALVVNVLLLVATAVASGVAWRQAVVAGRRQRGAESAEAAALEAQRTSAEALHEANSIAQQAKDLVQQDLDLERQRDERLREYRDVEWAGGWDIDIPDSQPPTFALKNVGTTVACSVTVVLLLPQGRQRFELGDVEPDRYAHAVMRDTEMRGPITSAAMGRHDMDFIVHWTSPAGEPSELAGKYLAD